MTIFEIKTRVLPGGRIEVQSSGLPEGQEVTINIVVEHEPPREKKSFLENLGDYKGGQLFRTVEEVDQYIQEERESWATDPPRLGPVYLDANSVIYRIEGIEPCASASAPLWEALEDGSLLVVTSELTLMEVLVKPLRDENAPLVALFRKILLDTKGLSCLAVDQRSLTGGPDPG